jgi:hypothetical protein
MTKKDISKAIVRFNRPGGQGVLVEGNFILTAAHCIGWNADGAMDLGKDLVEWVKPVDGSESMLVFPLAVESMSDIAVFGIDKKLVFPSDALRFKEFCARTEAVSLCKDPLPTGTLTEVFVWTYDVGWAPGSAMPDLNDVAKIWVQTEEAVEGGASGGPIINAEGELLAVNSSFSLPQKGLSGSEGEQPRPLLALPVWVVNQMECARKDAEDAVIGQGELVSSYRRS